MKNKKLDIIYEDNEILVVNKPSGLLTVSTPKEKEKTLFNQVFTYIKKKHKANKIFIVHRLDKDTSGIVLFAKKESIKESLQNNWNEDNIQREYIAVVEGKMSDDEGIIKSYLKENKTLRVFSTKDKTGKLSITEYKVLKRSKGYSLVLVNLKTGRKNQIRVHFSDLGHPVMGDKKYGAKTNPLRVLGLHASKLVITHPVTKEKLILESNIPDSFNKMFKGEKI